MAVVTLGSGLGFAFSRNDEVLLSPFGSPAFALYNLPYSDGILEDYVSKRGILKVYGDLGGDLSGGVTVKEVAARADKGEDAALRAFDSAGTALASALGPVLSENGIECLLFGGQISRSFHLMERSLRSGLHGGPLLTIGPVKSIDDSAFYGLHRCLSRA